MPAPERWTCMGGLVPPGQRAVRNPFYRQALPGPPPGCPESSTVMCGIAGILVSSGSFENGLLLAEGGRLTLHAALERMVQCLRHRGPNGDGMATADSGRPSTVV